MRFVVDECTGPTVAEWLRSRGQTVFSVYDEARGATDQEVIAKAQAEGWIVITADKDFGDLVFRDGNLPPGVVPLRLDDERAASKIAVLEQLLTNHIERLPGCFVVANENHVRFAPVPRPFEPGA